LAAALANKLARIAWTVLAQERSYEARVAKGSGLKLTRSGSRFFGVAALYPRLPGPPTENLHTNRHWPVFRMSDLM